MFIDDDYYASYKVNDLVTWTGAVAIYNVWKTNVIRKLANASNISYADTVIITSSEKTKLLNLCSAASSFSGDSRYQSIIDTLVVNINRYNGKTISYFNSHF